MTLMITLTEAVVAKKSSINRHTVEASKRLFIWTVSNTFGADWANSWFFDMIIPFTKAKEYIIR